MKKSVLLLLIMIMLLCSGCGNEQKSSVEPQAAQMKMICELATMDCYYHNVAKYKEEDVEGFLWWKKDLHFWVEYSGIVTIGIDTSLVKIEIAGENVTITMPPGKVLGYKVDETSFNEDSFIIAKGSADVDAEIQTKVLKEAQENILLVASEDKALLDRAQQRAMKLLEDYIHNIGNSVGKEYTIKWIYVDENGNEG